MTTTRKPPFEVGTPLANGAMIIAIHADPPIVLAVRPWVTLDPYATWFYDDGGHCFWGHYHQDVVSASCDYAERIQKSTQGMLGS